MCPTPDPWMEAAAAALLGAYASTPGPAVGATDLTCLSTRPPPEAFNWLLFGLSGKELVSPSLGCADDVFEETVMVVRQNDIMVWCDPRCYPAVVQLCGGCRNVTVCGPDASAASDSDLLEAHKIGAFVSFVKGVRRPQFVFPVNVGDFGAIIYSPFLQLAFIVVPGRSCSDSSGGRRCVFSRRDLAAGESLRA